MGAGACEAANHVWFAALAHCLLDWAGMTAFSTVAHRWRAEALVAPGVARVPQPDVAVPSDETATSSPARGVLLGLALCAPFWIAVFALVF